jgi:hypothetical protein
LRLRLRLRRSLLNSLFLAPPHKAGQACSNVLKRLRGKSESGERERVGTSKLPALRSSRSLFIHYSLFDFRGGNKNCAFVPFAALRETNKKVPIARDLYNL